MAAMLSDFSRVAKWSLTAESMFFRVVNRLSSTPPGRARSCTVKPGFAGSLPSANGAYLLDRYPLPAYVVGTLGMHTYGGRLFRTPNSWLTTEPNDGYCRAEIGRA